MNELDKKFIKFTVNAIACISCLCMFGWLFVIPGIVWERMAKFAWGILAIWTSVRLYKILKNEYETTFKK